MNMLAPLMLIQTTRLDRPGMFITAANSTEVSWRDATKLAINYCRSEPCCPYMIPSPRSPLPPT